MRNISIFRNCYGCGVCSLICPQKIISIELNGDGFYEPRITDTDRCIDCGLCLNACAFNDSEICVPDDRVIRSYGCCYPATLLVRRHRIRNKPLPDRLRIQGLRREVQSCRKPFGTLYDFDRRWASSGHRVQIYSQLYGSGVFGDRQDGSVFGDGNPVPDRFTAALCPQTPHRR